MNTAAIPYNRAVSRCVRSSRAWRERSRATLYSATERLLVSSSHGRLALSSVVAPRERLDERCTPRPSGFRAFLDQPSGVIVSRGDAAAARRTLYSSTERFPCLPRSTVLRHRQSWRRGSGSTNAVFLVRAASGPSSLNRLASSPVVAARERFCQRCIPCPSGSGPGVVLSRGRRASGLDERCIPRPSGSRAWRCHQSWTACGRFCQRCIPRPSGLTARCQRRASGSTNAVLLVRAVSPPEQRGACRGHFLEHAC